MSTNKSNELPKSLGYGKFGNEEDGGGEAEPTTQEEGELDQLASDMDETSNEEDPLERNLGWNDESEEEAEEGEEEESGEEDDPEGESSEGEEGGEGEETDPEAGEEEGEGEEGEDELYYDAERDFPDSDVQPTKYKDRISLNSGFTEKVRYLREKKANLEENGSRLGAIPLPDYFGDDEGKIDETVDREAFAELSDEEAKKAIHDMDVAIKRSSTKLDKVEAQKRQEQQKEEVTQEYQEAVDDLAGALDSIGIDVEKAKGMEIGEINAKADEAIAELESEENAEDFIRKNSAREWRQAIQELEDAKRTVSEFPEKDREYKEQQSKSKGGQEFDPELTKSTYEGFSDDRPDHPVYDGDSTAREEDFLEYARGKIERQEITPPQHEREWVSVADDYVEMIESEVKKYEKRKEKNSGKDKSGKSKTADDSPVVKDKEKKPNANDLNNQRSRRDVVTTSDIDSDLAALARDMN